MHASPMKWSDYCISAVRYDAAHTRLIHAETREDKELGIGSRYYESRDVVLKNLKAGRRYITIFKDDRGKWVPGQRVRLIKVNGAEFISTGTDETKEADLLENVPEYEPAKPLAVTAA
jgi:hypothetical protein